MNRLDLLELMRLKRVRRSPKRLRRLAQPDGIRLSYFKAIREGPLADARALVERLVVPRVQRLAVPRRDATDDEINNAIDEASDELFRKWTNRRFGQLVQPFANDTADMSRRELVATFRDALGIDIIGGEPWLADEIRKFVAENVALIKSVPVQYFDQLERTIARDVADGVRWEEISKGMTDRLGVAESRANLIARDQTGKFYGDLNRVRQKEIGVEGYIWRTSNDNRVREEHQDREGEHYDWDKPPEDGHPGEPILCRCFGEPDLAPLFEALGVD